MSNSLHLPANPEPRNQAGGQRGQSVSMLHSRVNEGPGDNSRFGQSSKTDDTVRVLIDDGANHTLV